MDVDYRVEQIDGNWYIVFDNAEGKTLKASRAFPNEETAKGVLSIWEGNPENIPLHESLSAIAQWLDYEGEVVEAAAEEIEDTDIAEAAEEQAEAMQEAAEAVSEAAEDAAETAAEVFVETGVPSDEQPAEVVSGNPTEAAEITNESNTTPVVEGNPEDWQEDNPNYLRCSVCNDWFHFNTVSEHYQDKHPEIYAEYIAKGNPTTSGETVAAVDIAPTAETPTTDTPPEPGHWYFKPVRKGR